MTQGLARLLLLCLAVAFIAALYVYGGYLFWVVIGLIGVILFSLFIVFLLEKAFPSEEGGW